MWLFFGDPHNRPTVRNQATANYLFCQQEIMKALYHLYYGYTQENINKFLFPEYDFTASLNDVFDFYKDNSHDRVVKKLPVIDLTLWKNPIDELPKKLADWRFYLSAGDWDKDAIVIKEYIKDDNINNDRLFHYVYDLRVETARLFHQKQVDIAQSPPQRFTYHDFILEPSTETLYVKEQLYPYKPGAKPFILFRVLIEHVGEFVKYIRLAEETGVNAYHKGVGNSKMARPIQDLKKELLQKLKDMGVPQQTIDDLDGNMVPSIHVGYKLQK